MRKMLDSNILFSYEKFYKYFYFILQISKCEGGIKTVNQKTNFQLQHYLDIINGNHSNKDFGGMFEDQR